MRSKQNAECRPQRAMNLAIREAGHQAEQEMGGEIQAIAIIIKIDVMMRAIARVHGANTPDEEGKKVYVPVERNHGATRAAMDSHPTINVVRTGTRTLAANSSQGAAERLK